MLEFFSTKEEALKNMNKIKEENQEMMLSVVEVPLDGLRNLETEKPYNLGID